MSNDNKRVNEAFIQGYERGKKDGERDAISRKYTPNQVREILGLPPIDGLSAKCTVVDEIAKNDPVNKPIHYTDGKIEVIEFIEDKNLGFCLGNAVKYIARAGKKDPAKEVEDLQKAEWYIKRRIKELEEASGK